MSNATFDQPAIAPIRLELAKRDIGRRTADVLDRAAFVRSIIRKPGSQMLQYEAADMDAGCAGS
jgi:hypothetical protein